MEAIEYLLYLIKSGDSILFFVIFKIPLLIITSTWFFPTLIIVIGWFVIKRLSRKNDIAKELRKYRLELLSDLTIWKNSSLSFKNSTRWEKDDYKKLSAEVMAKFISFCEEEEIKLFLEIEHKYNPVNNIEEEDTTSNFLPKIEELRKLMANNTRSKLHLKQMNFDELIKEIRGIK